MDGLLDGCVSRLADGFGAWVGGWEITNGCIDGWMHAWMCGWTDE